MKVFNVTVDSLQKKTNVVLNTFNTAIAGLSSVVEQAKQQAEATQQKIESATKEKEDLENIISNNSAIISKLQGIIGKE